MRENLKALRKIHNLTQDQTAHQVGITKRQYQALESGESFGSVPVWYRLKHLLGAPTIDYLLEQVDDNAKL